MATQYQMMHQHPALGGLDISSDPTVLDPGFLTIADNIEYLEGGQRKKRLGTTIYSTSTGNTNPNYLVSSSTPVRAVEDFWRYGASLTPSQNLVAVAGASIFGSTGDGKWTALTATSSFGQATNTKTFITLAGDYAVISDETAQPIAYNQTTLVAATSGSVWPRFTASRYHLSRLFMFGMSTEPSTVQYSGSGNIFDSTGTDSGVIASMSKGDGDQVIGCSEPFFASLYFFKGPNKGSIWQLSGNTPATFSLVQIGYGAPLLNPRAIVTTPTDVYWLSQYGIHSLETTVKFGNVEQAFLSLPIQRLWRDNLIKRDELAHAWAFWHPTRNVVGWCVTPSGDNASRWLLIYNSALSDAKPGGKKFWSIWKFPNFGLTCGEIVLTPATWDALLGSPRSAMYPVPIFGGDNGTVYMGDARILGDAGSPYTAQIRTPIISRFKTDKGQTVPETQEKQFAGIVTYINPKGNYTADLSISVDQRLQSTTINLAGAGNTLG